MSNKFLPFIVEKSPLHSIYQTMLSRSKGINTLTLLSVFQIVGEQGIKKVREFVHSQSEEMDTASLYQAISNHFNHSVNPEDLRAFNLLKESMLLSELTEDSPKFKEYGYFDIVGFIYVAAILGKSGEYFNIDYRRYLEEHAHVFSNLKEFITLDDKDPEYVVDVCNYDELASRVLYYALIDNQPVKRIVFRKVDQADTPPWESQPDYSNKPYDGDEGVPF